MSKPVNSVDSSANPLRILDTAKPETLRFIHQMLDGLKGKDRQGKVITKLRRYVRKPGKTDNNINIFTVTDPQGNKIHFGFDRSVIIFNGEDATKRQLFILKGKLATGSFGRVKNVVRGVDVISAQTGQESILKIIPFAAEPMPAMLQTGNATATNQPTVVKKVLPSKEAVVREAVLEKELGDSEGYVERFTHDSNKMYILQPKYPGVELFTCYENQIIKNFDEKLEIGIKLLKQLKSRFHDKGFLHRDLKAENIIYDQKTRSLRIIDMGFVVKGNKAPQYGTLLYYTYPKEVVGTHGMIAPEIFTHNFYSAKSDVYAMGKILALFLELSARITYTLNPRGQSIPGELIAINQSPYFASFKTAAIKETTGLGEVVAAKLAGILLGMSNPDLNKRLTVEQSLNYLDEIQKMRLELFEQQRKDKAASDAKEKSQSSQTLTKTVIKESDQLKAQSQNPKNVDNEMSRRETIKIQMFEEPTLKSRSTGSGSVKEMSDKENTTPPQKKRSPFE